MTRTMRNNTAVAARPPSHACWASCQSALCVVTRACGVSAHQLRLACRNVKVCQSREQLAALPPGPKAVLATLPSLEAGPAQELFVEWAGDPHSLILFTERPPVRSHPCPAHFLYILAPVPAPEDLPRTEAHRLQCLKGLPDRCHCLVSTHRAAGWQPCKHSQPRHDQRPAADAEAGAGAQRAPAGEGAGGLLRQPSSPRPAGGGGGAAALPHTQVAPWSTQLRAGKADRAASAQMLLDAVTCRAISKSIQFTGPHESAVCLMASQDPQGLPAFQICYTSVSV